RPWTSFCSMAKPSRGWRNDLSSCAVWGVVCWVARGWWRRAEGQRFVKRLPHLLASVLVQSDDAGARLAADEQDQQSAVDEWGRRARGKCDLVILLQILLPKYGPFLSSEAEEMAKPPQRVHLACADNRRCHGTDLLRWAAFRPT